MSISIDRSTLMYEGFRTFQEFDVTIEIVVIHHFQYGLFEVLARDQSSEYELKPVYLRSCIIEKRVSQADVDLLIGSSRSKFDAEQTLNDDQLFDLVVRASIFNYIADRLSITKNEVYELEYLPAASDLEFGPDKRQLDLLICKNPYRYGAPVPYKETIPEPVCVMAEEKELALEKGSAPQVAKPVPAPKRNFSSVVRTLSSLFGGVSMSAKIECSEKSIAATACVSRSSVEFSKSLKSSTHSIESNQDANEAQDLARQILDRLKELPDILGRSFGSVAPAPTPELDTVGHANKAVTPDQLAAYFAANGAPNWRQSDIEVRARIPFRQHPRLQPPKCVAHLVVIANRDNSFVWHIEESEESEKVASPLVVQQVKPLAKPLIPLLNLAPTTNESHHAGEVHTLQPRKSFVGMFLGNNSRVGIAPV